MKKLVKVMGVLGMALCMSACNSEPKRVETSVEQGEQVKYTNMNLEAPSGATNVTYSYIEVGKEKITKTCFTLDETKACILAKPTEEYILGNGTNLNALEISQPEINEDLMVGNFNAVSFIENGTGYIAWIDLAAGALYNVAIEDGATSELLSKVANMTYEPLQGDVDGSVTMEVMIQLLDDIYASEPGSAGSSLKVEISAEDVTKFIENHGSEMDEDIISSAIDAWANSKDASSKELLAEAIKAVEEQMADNEDAKKLLESIAAKLGTSEE